MSSLTSSSSILDDNVNSNKQERRLNILLGVSGSVASVKGPELAIKLSKVANVKVIMTQRGKYFWNLTETYNKEMFDLFNTMENIQVYEDKDEWDVYKVVGKDEVVHIELRRWADVMVIAPASANTIAKLAQGLCDNLLTCVARAWDFKQDKLIICPAMNTMMWDHPFTLKHLNLLKEIGCSIVEPQEKKLACGDIGKGALEKVDIIVNFVLSSSTSSSK